MTVVKYIRKEQDFSKSSGERLWVGLDGAGEQSRGGGSDDGPGGGLGGEEERPGVEEEEESHFFSSAAIVFLLAVVLAVVRRAHVMKEMKVVGPSPIKAVKISKHAWKEGFIKGAIPQLPLSSLKSVIAVCKLSSDLLPGKNCSVTSVSVAAGLMNLVGCWFGVMPCCHGAERLAGQYKFGGRSGGCLALLGAAKLVLGLVLGRSLAKLLNQFPVGVLGVLLLFAGIDLFMASRDGFQRVLCDSLVHSGCTGGVECSHWVCEWDCCAFAS